MQIVTEILDWCSLLARQDRQDGAFWILLLFIGYISSPYVSCGHRRRFSLANHACVPLCTLHNARQPNTTRATDFRFVGAFRCVNYDGTHNTIWLIIPIIVFVWCQRSIQNGNWQMHAENAVTVTETHVNLWAFNRLENLQHVGMIQWASHHTPTTSTFDTHALHCLRYQA